MPTLSRRCISWRSLCNKAPHAMVSGDTSCHEYVATPPSQPPAGSLANPALCAPGHETGKMCGCSVPVSLSPRKRCDSIELDLHRKCLYPNLKRPGSDRLEGRRRKTRLRDQARGRSRTRKAKTGLCSARLAKQTSGIPGGKRVFVSSDATCHSLAPVSFYTNIILSGAEDLISVLP